MLMNSHQIGIFGHSIIQKSSHYFLFSAHVIWKNAQTLRDKSFTKLNWHLQLWNLYLLIFPLLVLIVENEISVQFSLRQTTFKAGLNYESIKLNLGSIWLQLFSEWNTDIYLMSLYLSDITHELLKVCFTSLNSNQLVLY